MFSMILETLFSITLFLSGGHLVSTNLKLHHYPDEDYKGIFYLKHNDSITKHCSRHSELEDIKKMTRYKTDGGNEIAILILTHSSLTQIAVTLL